MAFRENYTGEALPWNGKLFLLDSGVRQHLDLIQVTLAAGRESRKRQAGCGFQGAAATERDSWRKIAITLIDGVFSADSCFNS